MRKLITAALLMLFMSISLLADDGFIIKSYHVEVLLQEDGVIKVVEDIEVDFLERRRGIFKTCLLYTSPSPRDRTRSRMPSSA